MLSDSIFDSVMNDMAIEVARYWHWSDDITDGSPIDAYADEYYDALVERMIPLMDMQYILDIGCDDILFEPNHETPKEVREFLEWKFVSMCIDEFTGD